MKINTNPTRIVLLPRPLSPLAAFAYFLLTKIYFDGEQILSNHYVRWTISREHREKPQRDQIEELGMIINLSLSDKYLREFVTRLLDSDCLQGNRWLLKKYANFFRFGAKFKIATLRWEAYVAKLSRFARVEDALSIYTKCIESALEKKVMPVSMDLELKFEAPEPYRQHIVDHRRVITIPITKRNLDEPDDNLAREIVDSTTKVLCEGKVLNLLREKIVILIGGNPGLGKSSVSAALYTEFYNEIKSLHSRGGDFNDLNRLRIGTVSLDAATPVVDAILEHRGQDRQALSAIKRPWSIELAHESVAKMKSALDEFDIVLADLPGKIDDITRLLGSCATFGILLAPVGEPSQRNDWVEYFKSLGIPIIVKIKSTQTGMSMLSQLTHQAEIIGRLRTPRRLITGADSFIRTMSELMLFDVMPGYLSKLHGKIDLHASGADLY